MAVLQIVKFNLKSSDSLEAFIALNQRFQDEVAPHIPGLERRESSISGDGKATLFIKYRDMESATAGPKADSGNPIANDFMSMVDMSSMSAEFFPLI